MVAVINEDKGVQPQIQLLCYGLQVIRFWQLVYTLRGEVLVFQ